MVDVNVRQKPKPVEYEPEIYVEYVKGGSGTTTQVSWENSDTRAALRQLFGLKPYEQLAAVIVTREGIKAEIKTVG